MCDPVLALAINGNPTMLKGGASERPMAPANGGADPLPPGDGSAVAPETPEEAAPTAED